MTDRRLFAIGDIHGHLDELLKLLDWVEENVDAAEIIFLGDYVDRGPDSKGVLDLLMLGSRRPQDFWQCISGNHEEFMLKALYPQCGYQTALSDRVDWLHWGGKATLWSFGVLSTDRQWEYLAELPCMKWLVNLPHWVETENHYFVHGGMYAGLHPRNHSAEILHGLRRWEDDCLESGHIYDKHVVYGHTDRPEVFRRDWCTGIDTGSGKGGRLTLAEFDRTKPTGPIRLVQADTMSDLLCVLEKVRL